MYNKKLIRRWDSERELFYGDILHVLETTIDPHINSGTDNDIGHTVFRPTVDRKPSIIRQKPITTVKRNLNDKLQVRNSKIHSTHECVNLYAH